MVENSIQTSLQSWRLRVQTRMMFVGVVMAFPAVIQTILRAAQHPNEWRSSIALISMYLGFVALAFNQRVPVRVRGGLFVLLLYLVGILALARGGLWGDGRIYLVLLPIFGILLIDSGAGMFLAAISILTYTTFGVFNHIGLLQKWMISHQSPMPTEIWIYDGLIFAMLMFIAVVMMADFYNLLMKTLSNEHKTTKNLRKAHHLLDEANHELEEKVSQRTAELAEANQRLQQLVNHDPLTGLPNRVLFYTRLSQMIACTRESQKKLAVMFIDLDNFKAINDTRGHLCGDILLTKLANRLKIRMTENNMVARLSGDEFAIILGNLNTAQDAAAGAGHVLEALAEPFDLGTSPASLSASLGISLYPDDAENPDELVRYADIAMYSIKHSTKSDFQFYTTDSRETASPQTDE